MKLNLFQGALAAVLLAATGSALETENHKNTNTFAQSQAQHAVTLIPGVLEPCETWIDDGFGNPVEPPTLIVCPPGQFVYRTAFDENRNCPCRYEMRECENQNKEFDTLTGECRCVECDCPNNQYWNFNDCQCDCLQSYDCPDPTHIWDSLRCECICPPEECTADPNPRTWNIATCQCECIIQPCSGNEFWDYDACACVCEPQECANEGEEWSQDLCECVCEQGECPRGWYFSKEVCGCLCKPQDCPASHYFDTRVCGCVCAPDDECASNQYWNTQTCRCECNVDNGCEATEYFDTEECACKCKPTDCDDGFIFSDIVCECVCCPQVCPANYYWNKDTCQCECTPCDCDSGYYWNTDHCHCDCVIVDCPTDNNINYYFDHEECSCKCHSAVSGCDGNDKFDTERCECVCMPETECLLGEHWDHEECKCVCKPQICPTNQYWHSDTDSPANCGCKCKPHFCSEGYHWDEDECTCVCSPADCTADFYWDSHSCRCRCRPQECPQVGDYIQIWDIEICDCICVEDPANACGDGDYFDHVDCECRCKPQDCDPGFYWDTSADPCRCVEEHCECAIGYFWNNITEECECLPQDCATGYEWNSSRCACQCADIDCVAANGPGFFFDPDSCSCRCYYKTNPTCEEQIDSEHYWDMDACACLQYPVDCTARSIEFYADPFAMYFDEITSDCVCVFKAPRTIDGKLYTWDTTDNNNCRYVCAPQTCIDDSYYWDSEQCKCACYQQDCPVNFVWDEDLCKCVCDAIPFQYYIEGGEFSVAIACPCGTVWSAECCECKPCQDKGECIGEQEFFNPNTCQCDCLPQCCPDGEVWQFEPVCACVGGPSPCDESDAVASECGQRFASEGAGAINTCIADNPTCEDLWLVYTPSGDGFGPEDCQCTCTINDQRLAICKKFFPENIGTNFLYLESGDIQLTTYDECINLFGTAEPGATGSSCTDWQSCVDLDDSSDFEVINCASLTAPNEDPCSCGFPGQTAPPCEEGNIIRNYEGFCFDFEPWASGNTDACLVGLEEQGCAFFGLTFQINGSAYVNDNCQCVCTEANAVAAYCADNWEAIGSGSAAECSSSYQACSDISDSVSFVPTDGDTSFPGSCYCEQAECTEADAVQDWCDENDELNCATPPVQDRCADFGLNFVNTPLTGYWNTCACTDCDAEAEYPDETLAVCGVLTNGRQLWLLNDSTPSDAPTLDCLPSNGCYKTCAEIDQWTADNSETPVECSFFWIYQPYPLATSDNPQWMRLETGDTPCKCKYIGNQPCTQQDAVDAECEAVYEGNDTAIAQCQTDNNSCFDFDVKKYFIRTGGHDEVCECTCDTGDQRMAVCNAILNAGGDVYADNDDPINDPDNATTIENCEAVLAFPLPSGASGAVISCSDFQECRMGPTEVEEQFQRLKCETWTTDPTNPCQCSFPGQSSPVCDEQDALEGACEQLLNEDEERFIELFGDLDPGLCLQIASENGGCSYLGLTYEVTFGGNQDLGGTCQCVDTGCPTHSCDPEDPCYCFTACDYFVGGIKFVGCHRWLGSTSEVEMVWNATSQQWEFNQVSGDVCEAEGVQYDIFTERIKFNVDLVNALEIEYNDESDTLDVSHNKPIPDFWRFYPDPKWWIDNALPEPTHRELFIQQHFPTGPHLGDGTLFGKDTDEWKGEWEFDTDYCTAVGESEPGCPETEDQGWFNEPEDAYYFHVRHDNRATAECALSFLGIDWDSCGELVDAVDALNVDKDNAPMIKFKLWPAVDDQHYCDGECYYWSAQIHRPEHACHGFYLDQNHVGDDPINYSRWTRERDQFALSFSNEERSIDQINEWNESSGVSGMKFYHQYYSEGVFQIPKRYTWLDTRFVEQDRYCHCHDAQCASWE